MRLRRGASAGASWLAPVRRGVTNLEQVAAMTDSELFAIHGVGPKAVRILRALR